MILSTEDVVPREHHLLFCSDPSIGNWESMFATLSDLLEPTDYWPPLFRVREFPNAEQLAKLTTTSGAVIRSRQFWEEQLFRFSLNFSRSNPRPTIQSPQVPCRFVVGVGLRDSSLRAQDDCWLS